MKQEKWSLVNWANKWSNRKWWSLVLSSSFLFFSFSLEWPFISFLNSRQFVSEWLTFILFSCFYSLRHFSRFSDRRDDPPQVQFLLVFLFQLISSLSLSLPVCSLFLLWDMNDEMKEWRRKKSRQKNSSRMKKVYESTRKIRWTRGRKTNRTRHEVMQTPRYRAGKRGYLSSSLSMTFLFF